MFFTNKFFYQKQKDNFISFIKRVIDFLPSILIGFFVSTISVNFYGKENASIGPICTLICGLKSQSFSIDNFPILALRVLLLGILATIAEQNLFCIILFNFIVLFYIVYFFQMILNQETILYMVLHTLYYNHIIYLCQEYI